MFRLAVLVTLALWLSPQETLRPPTYEEGQRIRMTLQSRQLGVNRAPVMVHDGEEVEPPDGRPDDVETLTEREVVYIDTVEATTDGLRDRVLREFETISLEWEGGALESALEGETLRLTREEDDEVEAEVVSDGDVDDALLQYYRLIGPIRIYLEDTDELPEVGDSWTLSEEAVERLNLPQAVYFEADAAQLEGQNRLRDDIELEITVTYRENDELDGVLCAVLFAETDYELEAEGLSAEDLGWDTESLGVSEGVDVWIDYESTGTLTRTAWVELATGRERQRNETEEYETVWTVTYEPNEGPTVEYVYEMLSEYTNELEWELLNDEEDEGFDDEDE